MPPKQWCVNSGCLMETKLAGLSRRYHAALQEHLEQGPRASSQSTDGLGRQALAKMHEQAIVALVSPSYSAGAQGGMIKRAQESGS